VVHRQNNLARHGKCPITNLLAVEDKLWIMRPGKQRVDVERPSSTAAHEQREEEQDDRRWWGHHAFDHCCHYFHPCSLNEVGRGSRIVFVTLWVTLSRVKQAPKVLLRWTFQRDCVVQPSHVIWPTVTHAIQPAKRVDHRGFTAACPVFHHVLMYPRTLGSARTLRLIVPDI
jgi:hypothetical protein